MMRHNYKYKNCFITTGSGNVRLFVFHCWLIGWFVHAYNVNNFKQQNNQQVEQLYHIPSKLQRPTSLASSVVRFKEWSKENVKTRTARSRTREGKRLGKTSSLEILKDMTKEEKKK
ncbi:hypothetical protein T07_8789 [Trichinella nelsoni]|uniref:Uncharacterized protein n=1 Tax=Trichinella nelsoni TaxID=6336 RepID=A0A0V0SDH3_9BILA|nr:hypothetical protein T07_8789 [Trichinella nelsoni]